MTPPGRLQYTNTPLGDAEAQKQLTTKLFSSSQVRPEQREDCITRHTCICGGIWQPCATWTRSVVKQVHRDQWMLSTRDSRQSLLRRSCSRTQDRSARLHDTHISLVTPLLFRAKHPGKRSVTSEHLPPARLGWSPGWAQAELRLN